MVPILEVGTSVKDHNINVIGPELINKITKNEKRRKEVYVLFYLLFYILLF